MGRETPAMEGEFELSLELSIGGCYANNLQREEINGGGNAPSAADVDEIPRSEMKTDVGAVNTCEYPDLDSRREMQASRRREARIKREVKKSRGGDDRLLLAETQQFHATLEEGDKIGATKAADKLINPSSPFGETKVSEGMQQQAQFLLPLVNGLAYPWVVPLLRGRNSGSTEAPPQQRKRKRSSSAVSLHRSESQKGSHLQLNNSLSIQQNTTPKKPATSSPKMINISNGYDYGTGASETSTTTTATDLHQHEMPCVSTTGNGPNGRTITGLLYKYTNSEVSIVCVCHRTFFTPAEFVRHAGGLDVTHPLRHITVVPSLLQS